MIPFNRASFEGKELTYLAQAVIDGHVSGNGPFTKRCEEKLSQLHAGARVLLTSSCTHALELSARLLDLRPGDEVIVPSFTFVSSAGAYLLHGGTPVFADVRRDTLNLCPRSVAAAITPRTRAICAVHYGGVAAQPRELVELAHRHDLHLIEDNAHGLGGSHDGRPLGTFGSLSTLSFHETKNVTSGEGGALVVNASEFGERAEVLREKGTDRSRFERGLVDRYTWVDVGSSWVMSDLLAGVLLGQLERFDDINARRHRVWRRYSEELTEWAERSGVLLPAVPERCAHTAHVFHLRLPSSEERERFIEHMKDHGVRVVFHYQALHLSSVGQALGGWPGQCPVAEEAAETLVRLPLHLELSDADIDAVVGAVRSFEVEVA